VCLGGSIADNNGSCPSSRHHDPRDGDHPDVDADRCRVVDCNGAGPHSGWFRRDGDGGPTVHHGDVADVVDHGPGRPHLLNAHHVVDGTGTRVTIAGGR
jgi:hypothetical protein